MDFSLGDIWDSLLSTLGLGGSSTPSYTPPADYTQIDLDKIAGGDTGSVNPFSYGASSAFGSSPSSSSSFGLGDLFGQNKEKSTFDQLGGYGGIAQGLLGGAKLYQGQQALDQANAQANDKYALDQQALAQQKDLTLAEIAGRTKAAKISARAAGAQTIQNAYQAYLQSLSNERESTQRGYEDLGNAIANPYASRAKVLR